MNKVFQNEAERDFSIAENRAELEAAIAKVEGMLGQSYPLVIGGEAIMTENKTASVNPCKKAEVIGYASMADEALADKAINVAHETFLNWRFTPVEVRADYVMRLIGVLQKHRSEIAAWMMLETGKNFGEADGEICEAIDFFNVYAQQAVALVNEGVPLVDSAVENNRCTYIPIGVGLVIPPWNFPFSIMAGMAVSAAVTGNTVVIKPATDSPITCAKFVELCAEAGFPAGVINYLPGSGGVIGDYIVQHPKTRFINFTGSQEVGLRINRLAAQVSDGQRWIKRVVAEMGGKNAMIIDSTADLDWAAESVAAAAFGFQGQKCSACSRAIVLADVYDAFVEKLVARAKAIDQGAGKDNASICAVISQKAFNSITNYIEIGRGEGKVVAGGTYDDSVGFYIAPTVISDVDYHTARIAKEEIFGPVVAVMKVESFEEALAVANDTEYGLTGSVYTQNRDHIELAKRLFHVGNLYFNRRCTGAVVGNHPFGGFNMSGTTAKTGTRDYLYNFLQLKSISENIAY